MTPNNFRVKNGLTVSNGVNVTAGNVVISTGQLVIGATAINATSMSDSSATAYSNAVSYTDTKIGTANTAMAANAATAYSNAIAIAANATNLTSGTVAFARLPSLFVGTTAIQSTSAAQAVSGITTLAAGNTTITGFANVTSTIQGGSSLTIAGAASGITTLAAGNTTITGFANVSTTLQVGTNTATFGTAAYIVSNGNVGIGTSSPGAKLDVRGNLAVGGVDAGPNFIAFRGTTADGPGSYEHTFIGERIHTPTESSELFLFKGNDPAASGPDRVRIGASEFRVDTYATALNGPFETVANSANLTTHFIVTNGGNVGIGNTAPGSKLVVAGTVALGNTTVSGTAALGNTTVTGFANVTSTIQGGSSLAIAGALSGVTTAAMGNTTITGFANVTSTIQGGSGLTIAGALSGVTTAAMGNTTITGFANVTSTIQGGSSLIIAGALSGVTTAAMGNTTVTGFANVTSTLQVGGISTFSANVVLGSVGVSANGGFGTAGHVLHSNGTATYWAADDNTTYDLVAVANTAVNAGLLRLTDSSSSNDTVTFTGAGTSNVSSNATHIIINSADQYVGTVTSIVAANGLNGGTITSTGTMSVLGGSTLTVNSTGAHVNSALSIASLALSGDLTVSGNLTVSGTRTYVNTTTLDIGDNIFTLNADLGAVAPSQDAGIEIMRGTSANVQFLWDETNDRWSTNGQSLAVSSLVAAGALSGVTTAALGNTTITGFANVTSTIQGGSSLTIAGAASGITTLAAGNTTLTGFANVSTTLQVGTNTATFGTAAYVVSNGNVGIGTSSPGTKLDVVGMVRTSDQFQSNGGSRDLRINDNFGGTVAAVGVVTNNPLMFFTNNTERVRIANTGNVGVGTTAPGSLLHVSRTLANDEWNAVTLSNKGSWSTASGKGALINVTDSDTVTNTVGKFGVVFDAAGYGAFVVRNLYSGSYGASGDVLYVRGDGNVGIGNTTPSSKLVVAGTVAAGNTTITGFANVTSTIQGGSSLTIAGALSGVTTAAMGNTTITGFANVTSTLQVGGVATFAANANFDSGVLFVDGTNNRVGVNTTTPGVALDVTGSARVSESVTIGTGGTYAAGTIYSNADWGMIFRAKQASPTTAEFSWTNAADTQRMAINNSGNLGIGTGSPQYRLDVNSGTTSNNIAASFGSTITAGQYSGIHFGYSEAANQNYRKSAIVFEREDGSARGKIHILNDGAADGGSAVLTDSKVTVQYDGNVGIGTTAPANKLHVVGSAGTLLRLDGGSGGTGTRDIFISEFDTTAYGGIIRYDSAADTFTVGTVENSVVVNAINILRASGNVGIGTLTPGAYKLNVAGQSYFSDTMNYGSGGNISWTTGYSDGTTQTFASPSSGSLALIANGTAGLFIKSNQNVGIGTTTPGYKLEVNGSFAATTKSFVIDHPTKPGMKLRYGSLEGPENGVYVRGRLRAGENTIQLPDYWEGLVDEDTYTVNLTPVGKHQELYVEHIASDHIIVGGENIDCFYIVYAERNDVEKLVVEF